jgi:putative hydrolase of the HAD superfamily
MARMAIDVILFDLGGVLVELAGVEKMLEWSEGVANTDELWQRWLRSESVRRFETGAIGADEFARGILREFGVPVSPSEFLDAFRGWPRGLYPGARQLLAELAPRYRLASVSNTNVLHWTRLTGDWSLDRAFHHNFPSHQVGKLKPDLDYFRHVLEAVAAPPERVLFIDDNAINVDAAAALGLNAHRALGVEGAREVCAALGLEIG